MSEMILLQIRSKIAEKEFISARANRENSLDGWMCDWSKEIENLNQEIEELFGAYRNSL